jgi:hypothetical protein
MLVLSLGWQLATRLHQMPAAQAELRQQRGGMRGSAARTSPTFPTGQPALTMTLAECQSAGCCQCSCNRLGRATEHRPDGCQARPEQTLGHVSANDQCQWSTV